MDLKSSWYNPINRLNPDIRMLMTFGVGRRSDSLLSTHPGTWGRVVRACTHQSSEVLTSSGRLVPYWPTVQEWPNITYVYEPESRRVNNPTTSIKLLNQSGYLDKFFTMGHSTNSWAQCDLWTPGTPLEDSITILAGPVTRINFDSPGGSVTLDVEDGYDGHPLEFPYNNEFLDLDEFPELSEERVGKARRVFLLNANITFIPCVPINKRLTEYYVCEPAMPQMPSEVWIGSEQVTKNRFKFTRGRMASSGQDFTKLTFSDRIENLGYSGVVQVHGGSGPNTQSPLKFFLDRIPNLQITERARGHFRELDRAQVYDYFVVVNNNGPIIPIITERMLPMSDLVSFFRGGRLDAIKQGDATRTVRLTMHSELEHRLPATPSETDASNIHNAIDIGYRRNFQPVTDTFSRYSVHIDKTYGGTFGKHLARSEELYGRLFMRVDASDLGKEEDARRLGISILQQTAYPHRIYKYHMSYRYGITLDINDRVFLTDPFLKLTDLNCRVTQMHFLPTGINVSLQSEDSDVAF